MHWHKAAHAYASRGTPYVLVSILATSGSTPRAPSAKMVIAPDHYHDSIGGGQLEHMVIERARQMLEADTSGQQISHFPLAAATLQCCGGSVTILFESFASATLAVTVFGAGHVGTRVIELLEDMGARLAWYDSRGEFLGNNSAGPDIPGVADSGTRATPCQALTDPIMAIAKLAASSHAVILTHDHQLDYQLISALLSTDHPSIGMIGSKTKWQRFCARLLNDGYTQQQLDRVHCPIGDPSVQGKQPMAIAVAIVAELIQLTAKSKTAIKSGLKSDGETKVEAPQTSLTWRQIKSSLIRSDAS